MPARVHLACGGIHGVSRLLSPMPARPFIVAGTGSSRRNGALDALLEQFPHSVLLEGTPENPGAAWCEAGAEQCRQAECDWVFGVGGGSPLDAAKAIALLAPCGGKARDFFGDKPFPKPPLPLLAVPTTAGSGSEVTPYAVLVDEADGQKRTIRGEGLFPRLALLDPELTRTLPRSVTLATGLDALSQGMEGFVSRRSTPLGDLLALEVCRLVREWLPRAANAPDDLEARSAMMHAAMLSGMLIAQSGTTLVHGMGYYYTLHCGITHGLANALLLAPVFRHNALFLPEKVAVLAGALGVDCSPTQSSAAAGIQEALSALFETLDVSPRASDHGVRSSQLAFFAQHILTEPGRFRNQPGEFAADQVLRLFKESFNGCPA